MYQDIPALEIGSSNKIKGISYDAFLIKYKEYIEEEKKINEVLNTTTKRLILKSKNKLIGEVGIRTTLNDFWINKGSQIYYKIRLSERNKGYGNTILFLALKEAKKLGFKKIRINCNDKNILSCGYHFKGYTKSIQDTLQPRYHMYIPLINKDHNFLTESEIKTSFKKRIRSYIGNYHEKSNEKNFCRNCSAGTDHRMHPCCAGKSRGYGKCDRD